MDFRRAIFSARLCHQKFHQFSKFYSSKEKNIKIGNEKLIKIVGINGILEEYLMLIILDVLYFNSFKMLCDSSGFSFIVSSNQVIF